MLDPAPTHLTPAEVAARLRCSTQTLANWRVQGRGPRFMRRNGRILYPLAELDVYEQSNTVRSTAEYRG